MARTNVYVDRPATSWGAVLGGWVATVGASVIFAPLVGGLIAAVVGSPQQGAGGDLTLGVPVVLGLLLSYIVGGYVAGRMAGYRTSWHGLMTAFFSLLVLLVAALIGWAAGNGYFAGIGITTDTAIGSNLGGLDMYAYGTAITFSAILGFLAAIFGGWLGGLLAPPHVEAAVMTRRAPPIVERPVPHDERRDVVERRPAIDERPRPMQPAYGMKGGDRDADVDERTTRLERNEDRLPDE